MRDELTGEVKAADPEAEREARIEEIIRATRDLQLTPPAELVAHTCIHFDEEEAIRFFRWKLPELFPGTDMAQVPVVFIENNNAPYKGKTGWEHLAAGTYIIGCGGPGPWNHHPHSDYPGFCSADLVAVALGIEDMPELRKLLQRIRQNDLEGGGALLAIAEYLRNKNVQTAEQFEEAYEWIGGYVNLHIEAQTAFFAEKMEEDFSKTAKVWSFKRGDTEIPVCTLNESEQKDIVRFAQMKTDAEVIILRRKWGNVQIFTFPSQENLKRRDYRKRVGLKSPLAMLRQMEQRAMGLKEINEDWDDLTKEGFLYGWYNQKNQTALNGSDTSSVNPTLIPLSRIEEAVMIGNRFREFPWDEWLERVGRKDLSESMF